MLAFYSCQVRPADKQVKQTVLTDTVGVPSISQYSFPYVSDSLQGINAVSPFKIPSYRLRGGKAINREQYDQLLLQQVFGTYDSSALYQLFDFIHFPNEIDAFIFQKISSNNLMEKYAAIYADNTLISDTLKIHEYRQSTKSDVILSFAYHDRVYVENLSNGVSTEYFADYSGKFINSNRRVTFRHYRYINQPFGGYVQNMPKRAIKNPDGVTINDSLGNLVKQLPFGSNAYLVDPVNENQSPDANIRIVINTDSVTTGRHFYVASSNIGYVANKDLFAIQSTAEPTTFHHQYGRLQLGDQNEDNEINLNEILDISEVRLSDYKSQILKESRVVPTQEKAKDDNELTLDFQNGQSLTLRDTAFRSEYSPKLTYHSIVHPDFVEAYVVSQRMIFMEELITVLSKQNGDSMQQFVGYPHLSPNKKLSIAVVPDWTECIQDTFLEIRKLKSGRFEKYVRIYVDTWSYPFKMNEQNLPVEDLAVYWLSDDEFILKVKNYEECHIENDIEIFYLKFKVL